MAHNLSGAPSHRPEGSDDGGDHDDADALPDPSELTPAERVDSLVKSVEQDDALMVLLVLHCVEDGEVNAGSFNPLFLPFCVR